MALAVLLFGLLVPAVMGFGFLDPPVQLLYACLGPFFLSRPLERHSPAAAAVQAWGAAVLTHAIAIASLSSRLAPGYWLAPDWRFLAGAAAAGFGLTFFAAFLGVLWGGGMLRRVFLILLLILALAGNVAPGSIRSKVTALLVPMNALVFGPVAGAAFVALGLYLQTRQRAGPARQR